MISVEIEVAVMDGDRLIQRWPCRTDTLPDGSPAAWWRGVLCPLLEGPGGQGTINVAMPPDQPASSGHAVLAGEEATWVLVQGNAAALELARSALSRRGTTISRHGRWLGETVDGQDFDFFLRCDGWLDPTLVASILSSSAKSTVAVDPAVLIGMLEQRLTDMRAELANMCAVLARMERASMQSATRQVPDLPQQPSVPITELQEAIARADAIEARLAVNQVPATRAALKLKDELAEALAALRPDLLLLRDTLVVITGEFGSRTGTLRAIAELPASGSRPDGWKMLRGAERWWERHVNTGRNDLGRAYARFDTLTRSWRLLVGVKGSQAQDVEWLSRQG